MDAIYNFDFAVLDALQSIHTPVLTAILKVFSAIGEGGYFWIALALILAFIKKTRKTGLSMCLSLLFVQLINEMFLKNTVKRPRPYTLRPEVDTILTRLDSYSFPSGHTCTAFACSTAIFCFNKKLGAAAYVLSALIAFSRNYFFMHFPTDVLFAMLEGILFGVLASLIVKRIADRMAKKKSEPSTEEE